ncbi:MAG: Gfo/Idh/MocA family oxidoreductase, partial [Paracoccaceae bacterium]
MRRIRLGMVGGGQGSFIGAVHRIASRIDDRFILVAGALSSDPTRAAVSAQELGIDPKRSYATFSEMARAEANRGDGIEAVSIVTPNHVHADAAIAFLEAGIHVICDKPLTVSSEDAARINAAVEASKARFFLTHNYTGYPLIR